jgi:hypothetical protein
MSLIVGGKKKTKFSFLKGMPDTHSMAGMPDTHSMAGMPNTHSMAGMPKKGSPGTMEAGLTDYDYMPTIPGKRYGYKTLKGMPNTRQLNGGWGADHPGNIENQNKTKSLLQKKRDSFIQDPQDKRNQGKMKLDETDNVPGFLKDKLSRNGSLSIASDGLCLKGEEDGGIWSDWLFYRSGVDGKRLWSSLPCSGSVSFSRKKLCLEGEEDGENPSDGTFYGIRNGKRGWYYCKEEDTDVPFPWLKGAIGKGGVMVGRTWIEVKGVLANKDGYYAVEVRFSAEGDTAEIAHFADEIPKADEVFSYIPLYKVEEDGKRVIDLRPSMYFIQCWEG